MDITVATELAAIGPGSNFIVWIVLVLVPLFVSHFETPSTVHVLCELSIANKNFLLC